MRTVIAYQADPSRGHAKRDEILAKQPYAYGSAIRGGEFVRTEGRQPVLPHQVTHFGARAHSTEQFVGLFREHDELPSGMTRSASPDSLSSATCRRGRTSGDGVSCWVAGATSTVTQRPSRTPWPRDVSRTPSAALWCPRTSRPIAAG